MPYYGVTVALCPKKHAGTSPPPKKTNELSFSCTTLGSAWRPWGTPQPPLARRARPPPALAVVRRFGVFLVLAWDFRWLGLRRDALFLNFCPPALFPSVPCVFSAAAGGARPRMALPAGCPGHRHVTAARGPPVNPRAVCFALPGGPGVRRRGGAGTGRKTPSGCAWRTQLAPPHCGPGSGCDGAAGADGGCAWRAPPPLQAASHRGLVVAPPRALRSPARTMRQSHAAIGVRRPHRGPA